MSDSRAEDFKVKVDEGLHVIQPLVSVTESTDDKIVLGPWTEPVQSRSIQEHGEQMLRRLVFKCKVLF